MSQIPEKIVSGGQTGADRAALDWAIERGVPHGGWCPKGRRAEDGPIDGRYQLNETPSANYVQRTEWNARDSDATVVFSIGEILTGGSRKTIELAHKHGKPALHLSKASGISVLQAALRRFIEEHDIKVLNVAGPRASKEPEVAAFVKEVLDRTWPQRNRPGVAESHWRRVIKRQLPNTIIISERFFILTLVYLVMRSYSFCSENGE